MPLQGLPYISSAQRGSYSRIQYCVVSEAPFFIRAVTDDNVLISVLNIPFKELPVAEGSPKPYDIATSTTKQGVIYNLNISGLLKDVSAATLLELRRMKNLDFILKMTLLNNDAFLAAEPEFPADFDFSIEGGDFGMNKGRVKFKFKGKSPNIMCKIQ